MVRGEAAGEVQSSGEEREWVELKMGSENAPNSRF